MERLLGRSLREDEEVTVMAAARRPLPAEPARQAAGKRLDQVLDKAASNLSNVPDRVFNTAVDEAMTKGPPPPLMRVVLDTNILARAAKPSAAPARELLTVLRSEPHRLVLSS